MSDINTFINTTEKFTAAPDGIPAIDRSQQMSYGIGMAQRAAEQSQRTPEPPAVMPPIIPVAN
jgi:hypothetical protein